MPHLICSPAWIRKELTTKQKRIERDRTLLDGVQPLSILHGASCKYTSLFLLENLPEETDILNRKSAQVREDDRHVARRETVPRCEGGTILID